MPVTNPWPTGPAPTKRPGRERLAERILNLLSSRSMCVLATTGPDGPPATPCATATSTSRSCPPPRPAHVERSLPLDEPPGGPLVVVAAERIVCTEHRLRRDGCAPRQFWRAG